MCMPGQGPPSEPFALWCLVQCNVCYCFFNLLLLGCELTASTKSYTFQVDEEDDSDHILALSTVREM